MIESRHFQLRKGVKRKADTTTPTTSYSNDMTQVDYNDPSFEEDLKMNAHPHPHPGHPQRRESVRQIKKPKRDLPEEAGATVTAMVNSHLLTPSEVN
jgi:hypothetical protein